MGNFITSNPVASVVIAGLLVLSVAGFLIYYYYPRKNFRIEDFNTDDNIRDGLNLFSPNNFARALTSA